MADALIVWMVAITGCGRCGQCGRGGGWARLEDSCWGQINGWFKYPISPSVSRSNLKNLLSDHVRNVSFAFPNTWVGVDVA